MHNLKRGVAINWLSPSYKRPPSWIISWRQADMQASRDNKRRSHYRISNNMIAFSLYNRKGKYPMPHIIKLSTALFVGLMCSESRTYSYDLQSRAMLSNPSSRITPRYQIKSRGGKNPLFCRGARAPLFAE